MYVKLHSTKDIVGGNKGTSTRMFEYLEKENIELNSVDKTYFFSNEHDYVSMEKAIQDVDGNWRGLKKDDTKYFMLTINPSQHELKHIENNRLALMNYTRVVMDEYAKGFKRQVNGKELTGKDLIYFAKIEKNRYYSERSDKNLRTEFYHNKKINIEIKKVSNSELPNYKKSIEIHKLKELYKKDYAGTVIHEGNIKPGLNTHIHVVVARKDKSQKVSLSPFSKSKGNQIELNGKKVQVGFNRKEFQIKCENSFDQQFKYERNFADSFHHKLAKMKGERSYLSDMINLPKNQSQIAKRLVLNLIDNDKQIQKMMNPIMRLPTTGEKMYSKAIEIAAKEVAKLLVGGVTPTDMAVRSVVSRVLSTALGTGLGL
jgi:hypothetical protein